ncbi:hypothetical protein IFM89_015758 [Coptis chinensis]|uniref:Uncharacterized protein n=1 Tax=Coptis chinensis TaxID=261450 RepID=A0A835HER7_9MAGN|nr:hypothetical protein IFM89_015758 [Coptis chinensis]
MDGAIASKKRIAYARLCIEVEFSSELPKSFKAQEEAMNDTNTTNQGVESSCARNDTEVPVHEPGSESQSDILIDTTEITLVIPADDPSLTRLGSTHNSIAVVEENNIELTVLMDAIIENLMAPGIPEHNEEVPPMAIELDDEGSDYDLLEMATPNPYSALSLYQEDMERFNKDEGLDISGTKDDDISVEETEYFYEHLVPIDNRELQLVVAEVTSLASRTGTDFYGEREDDIPSWPEMMNVESVVVENEVGQGAMDHGQCDRCTSSSPAGSQMVVTTDRSRPPNFERVLIGNSNFESSVQYGSCLWSHNVVVLI